MGRGEGFWGGVFWIGDGVVGVVLLVVNECFMSIKYLLFIYLLFISI